MSILSAKKHFNKSVGLGTLDTYVEITLGATPAWDPFWLIKSCKSWETMWDSTDLIAIPSAWVVVWMLVKNTTFMRPCFYLLRQLNSLIEYFWNRFQLSFWAQRWEVNVIKILVDSYFFCLFLVRTHFYLFEFSCFSSHQRLQFKFFCQIVKVFLWVILKLWDKLRIW